MPESSVRPSIIPKSASSVWKLFIIGFIILVLMIPVAWISSIIHERNNRKESVVEEIAAKSGGSQVVAGPFISVPYTVSYLENGAYKYRTNYLHITPENLKVTGKVESTTHQRGIFKVPGYTANLSMEGSFPAVIETSEATGNVIPDWANARLTFCIGDDIGLKSLKADFNGTPLIFRGYDGFLTISYLKDKPGASKRIPYDGKDTSEPAFDCRFAAKLPSAAKLESAKVKLNLVLTGTEELTLLASALNESIDLSGNWTSPSFDGDVLPDSRKVSSTGFTAQWNTNYLSTGNKPLWTNVDTTLRLSRLSTKFIVMVDSYQQTTRTLKYCILFLLLTFMAFFFTETVTRQRIHPIQYLMVGSSLIVFYLLLLSISEHLGFGWSYLLAAFAVILQISLYSYTILRTRSFAVKIGALLTGIYAFLYVLLRLEDSALLVGSIGLFILLGIAMYLIRNINWYNQE